MTQFDLEREVSTARQRSGARLAWLLGLGAATLGSVWWAGVWITYFWLIDYLSSRGSFGGFGSYGMAAIAGVLALGLGLLTGLVSRLLMRRGIRTARNIGFFCSLVGVGVGDLLLAAWLLLADGRAGHGCGESGLDQARFYGIMAIEP